MCIRDRGKPGLLFTGDPEKLIVSMFAHSTSSGSKITTNELRDITSLGKTAFQNLLRGKGVDVAKAAHVARVVDPYLEIEIDKKGNKVSKLWLKRHNMDGDKAKEMLVIEVKRRSLRQRRDGTGGDWEYTYKVKKPGNKWFSANSPLPVMVVRAVLGGCLLYTSPSPRDRG